MAKPLRDPQPSSTVLRWFDGTAAARALAAPETPANVPPEPTREPNQETADNRDLPTRKRLFMLTASTSLTVDRLVNLYRTSTCTSLNAIHVLRAVLIAVDHAFESLEREGRGMGKTKLPSNARACVHQRERFERQLAAAIVAGLRAAAMMRPD